MNKHKIMIALSSLFFSALACSTSPTGKRQLTLVPEEQMSSMGVQAFDEMKTKVPIEKDPAVNNYVRCITNDLIESMPSGGAPSEWEVVVFKNKDANAFALPGKKIGVHTGLLDVAKTPDQLAAVIGHEIGHVIANHSNVRVSESLAARTTLDAVSSIMSEKGQYYDLIMAALGLGAQYGVMMPHGRDQEKEADLIGLKLMAQAGFNPHESVELWNNMSQAGGDNLHEWLSTHPSHGSRITNLKANMDEALAIKKANPSGPSCKVKTTRL